MEKTYAFYIGGIQLANIDDQAGIIKDVRLITEGSALGHNIDIDSTTIDQILKGCQSYKNGVKVKMDHSGGAGDIPGYVTNFRKASDKDGEYLLADLHLFSNHPQRDYVLELAKTIPDTFGLSCFFIGKPEIIDGRSKARCSRVFSCDIVTEPAANPSLFSIGPILSSPEISQVDKPKKNMSQEEFEAQFKKCMDAYSSGKQNSDATPTVVPTKETHQVNEDGSEKHVITKGATKSDKDPDDDAENEMAARISGLVLSQLTKAGVRIQPSVSSTETTTQLSQTKEITVVNQTFEDICQNLRIKGDDNGKKYGIEEAIGFAIRNYPKEHFDYIKRCQAEGPEQYEHIQLSRDSKNYVPPFNSKVEHWKVQGSFKPGAMR